MICDVSSREKRDLAKATAALKSKKGVKVVVIQIHFILECLTQAVRSI
jgi:hypothetical protein